MRGPGSCARLSRAGIEAATRDDANTDAPLDLLQQATGIFVTGGSRARLIELLDGTRAMECIRERNAEGVIVAGTSAGASIVAGHARVAGSGVVGDAGDAAARKGMVELGADWGLVQDMIIDQHFNQAGGAGGCWRPSPPTPG